ncbi:Integrase [Rhodovulum sp. PH10]|uniref:tyrosine-type recombinase/integrase n=1 Tax=Rhodovulum sp. PH10 TaxID=1187851 RepID=UPI00027C23BB|nr:tyrosine-type recombinase/integrase [Rhodovulum sp. PH10]EJW10826.1 Integrase [Rhodovulum sp. PH10]
MPDFLTRRNGTWHFVRRVPNEFRDLDPRGIVKHTTRIRVASDRTGRRASRVAIQLNEALEAYWQELAARRSLRKNNCYEDARRRARSLGFDYVENAQLLMLPAERRLERLEALVLNGVADDAGARAALLGTEKRPPFLLSKLFVEYEAATKDETRDFSPNQLRVWRNGRERALKEFVKLIGDKPVTDVTVDDGIDYCEWWRDRVVAGETNAKTANKAIGQLSRMLKEMNIRRRLNLPEIFRGLRLKGEVEKSRSPFEAEFIQNRLLAPGALDGLNEDARLVLYVVADTGLRLSEAVNLRRNSIHLDAPIPYVEVLPDGRRLKTEDSRREIPLVGAALAALKLRPDGFPRYRDKASSLSAAVNKFLGEHGLRPTEDHTVYSLRHSFKDRLVAAEAPDSLIDNLMGHRTGKPKYGKGPPLELKLKFLQAIAFTPPSPL